MLIEILHGLLPDLITMYAGMLRINQNWEDFRIWSLKGDNLTFESAYQTLTKM